MLKIMNLALQSRRHCRALHYKYQVPVLFIIFIIFIMLITLLMHIALALSSSSSTSS